MNIEKLFMSTTLVLVAVLAGCSSEYKKISLSNEFVFPSTGISVKNQAVLLAIDDVSLPLKKNLCYYMSQPKVRRESILKPSRDNPNAPDYIAASFYGTVLLDNEKFRMWYYAIGSGNDWSGLRQGPICYAESDDGLHWTKPNLGQVLYKGSRNNNAIALPITKAMQTAAVIKDQDDPNPDRRYKMAYNEWREKIFALRTATSPDGIHWTAGAQLGIDQLIEHSSLYKYNDLFFVNTQTYGRSESGDRQGRQGYALVSPDFDYWLQESAESFTFPEPLQGRGILGNYDQVHIGVAPVSYGNVLVGLYCLWHQRGEDMLKRSGDFGLVVSNDGIHFHEPVKGHMFISSGESPSTPVEGKSYRTILCQGNGILNFGDETRIYHGRWRNAMSAPDYYSEIALAILPRDRWGALGLVPPLAGWGATPEGATEGSVWSMPITLPEKGCELVINADDANCISVEISDARFNMFPEFSGENSGVVNAKSGLECPVTWPGGSLSAFGNRTVRLRINFKRQDCSVDPRLFAIYLKSHH